MSAIFASSAQGEALRALLAQILRRLDDLETANPLNYASIDDGTGIGVSTARGVHVEGSGSMSADGLVIDRANGGRARVGNAFFEGLNGGQVGSGGTWIRGDGTIFNASGEVVFASTGRFNQGASVPYRGAQSSIGPTMEAIDTKAGNAASAASSARTAAQTAQNRADAAYELASSGASEARVDAVNFKLNQVIDRVNEIEAFIEGKYPDKPIRPPISKG